MKKSKFEKGDQLTNGIVIAEYVRKYNDKIITVKNITYIDTGLLIKLDELNVLSQYYRKITKLDKALK